MSGGKGSSVRKPEKKKKTEPSEKRVGGGIRSLLFVKKVLKASPAGAFVSTLLSASPAGADSDKPGYMRKKSKSSSSVRPPKNKKKRTITRQQKIQARKLPKRMLNTDNYDVISNSKTLNEIYNRGVPLLAVPGTEFHGMYRDGRRLRGKKKWI